MDTTTWQTQCGNYINLTQWIFYKYCTCGGTPRFKYKHNQTNMQLWVMPLRNKFSVFKNGPALINAAPLNQITERLQALTNTT